MCVYNGQCLCIYCTYVYAARNTIYNRNERKFVTLNRNLQFFFYVSVSIGHLNCFVKAYLHMSVSTYVHTCTYICLHMLPFYCWTVLSNLLWHPSPCLPALSQFIEGLNKERRTMIGVEEMCTEVKARCTLLLRRYVCTLVCVIVGGWEWCCTYGVRCVPEVQWVGVKVLIAYFTPVQLGNGQ